VEPVGARAPLSEGPHCREAVDAVRAGRAAVRGHEVPGPGLDDESQGIEAALHRAVGAPVADLEALDAPDGVGDDREVLRLVPVVEPPGASSRNRSCTRPARARSSGGRVAMTLAWAAATTVPRPSSAATAGTPESIRAPASS